MPHVLVIEDDSSTQTLYGAVLRLYGIDCTIAGDGARALEEMRRTRFDAVIVDLMMQRMNGFEVLRQLHRVAPETLSRVIVCSGTSEEALADCEELPLVQKFLSKPVDVRELVEEVVRVVRGRQVTPFVRPGDVDLLNVPLLRDAS